MDGMTRLQRTARGLALALMLVVAGSAASAQDDFTSAQRQAIIGILRDALRDDPTILRDALAAAQAAERRQRESSARAAIAAHGDVLFRDPDDPVKGNPMGTVTVVEFFDARCGYCKRMEPEIVQALGRDPEVRLVLKDLPILGAGSVLAARALLAAQRQGEYVKLHDAVMALSEEPAEPVLRREAERLGLDWVQLRRDMDDPAVTRRIQADMQLAQALRIEGTPALIIGDQLIPGAVDLARLEAAVAVAKTEAHRQ